MSNGTKSLTIPIGSGACVRQIGDGKLVWPWDIRCVCVCVFSKLKSQKKQTENVHTMFAETENEFRGGGGGGLSSSFFRMANISEM